MESEFPFHYNTKMVYVYVVAFIIILYILFDVNYFLRTIFTLLCGSMFSKELKIDDVSTIYGLGTFQDCDIFLKTVRVARLLREIDFARYHFYERTGILKSSKDNSLSSLQGSTMTLTMEPVTIFTPYKINTKLVYWDERSLFFEHEVITLWDDKPRCLLISRQYAIGKSKHTTGELLRGLPGSDKVRECPEHIEHWMNGMKISSANLRSNM